MVRSIAGHKRGAEGPWFLVLVVTVNFFFRFFSFPFPQLVCMAMFCLISNMFPWARSACWEAWFAARVFICYVHFFHTEEEEEVFALLSPRKLCMHFFGLHNIITPSGDTSMLNTLLSPAHAFAKYRCLMLRCRTSPLYVLRIILLHVLLSSCFFSLSLL